MEVSSLQRIGTSKKGENVSKEARNVPGPGNYDTRSQLSGPKYPFGTDKRGDKKGEGQPGPGSYRIPCTFADVPRYLTASGKFEENWRFI